MDRTGIIVVSICVVLLGVWFVKTNKDAARLAEQQRQFLATNVVVATTSTVTSNAPSAVAPTPVKPSVVFDADAPEQLIVLTNANVRYTFTSRGGGLKLVEFPAYPETVSARWKKSAATNAVATLDNHTPAPTLAILGDTNLVGDGNFTLTRTANGVRAEKLLSDGLQLTKEFALSSNYLINATVRLENTSNRSIALSAQEWVVGTATPMGPDDTAKTHGLMWSDGSKVQDHVAASFAGGGFGCSRGTPLTEYRGGMNNVAWAAAHNQFFTLTALPKQPAEQVVARPVNLPSFTTNGAPTEGILATLVYPAQALAAHSDVERSIVLYAGPKEYRTLAVVAQQFNSNLDQVMGFDMLFPFYKFGGFFAKVLLVVMNWLHDITHLGYGLVIVLITVLIKILFWPLTTMSTRSMKRMQELAPQLKELQAKYKDDMQKLSQKQWELYKKNKVNPMSGCLPMLVQMPVFIGFFMMIRSAIELRGAHFLWVADLAKPDTLFMIPGITFIPFISTPEGLPFNLLPLLMGASMLWQSHLAPQAPGMDPVQQKMMRWLPAIFILFLYNYSAGLALYWTTNNLLTVLQTKLTKTAAPLPPAAPTTVAALTPTPKTKK